jgi:DNA helicase II / ATP-dependent DNA helicase PcrA
VSPQLSEEQLAVLAHVRAGQGSALVVARAGSGKTETSRQATGELGRGVRAHYCAFNKDTMQDMRARGGVLAGTLSTVHSLGFRVIRKRLGPAEVDSYKTHKLARKLLDKRATSVLVEALAEAVAMAKNTCSASEAEVHAMMAERDLLPAYDVPTVRALMGAKHSLHLSGELKARGLDDFVTHVLSLLHLSRDAATVDYDDMVWLPVVLGLEPVRFDHLIVDEGQDTNRAAVEFLVRSLAEGGRALVVLDPAQRIYSFRGADPEAMERFVSELSIKTELHLSVSWRCAQAIVAEARKLVPEIAAAPGAPEGRVRHLAVGQLPRELAPGDAVLGRTGSSLLEVATSLLLQRKELRLGLATEEGKRRMLSTIDRARASSVDELLTYVDRTIEEDSSRNAVESARCVRTIALKCDDVARVRAIAEDLFDPPGEVDVELATVHKAKGREWGRVFLLEDSFAAVEKNAKSERERQEEKNCRYVAVTRAKEELAYVHE